MEQKEDTTTHWVDEIGKISDIFELEIMHLTQNELLALRHLINIYIEEALL